MTEGYKSKEYGVPTKRFVQTMDLKDDSELIRKYREAHDKEHFWNAGSGLSFVLMIFVIASMTIVNIFDKEGEGTSIC